METEENPTLWYVLGAMTLLELGIRGYRRTGRFLAHDATVAYRLSALTTAMVNHQSLSDSFSQGLSGSGYNG